MRILFEKRAHDFRPWKPPQGRVFTKAFAFDCETTRIARERPWAVPDYVLGAAFDGEQGYFVERADAAAFFAGHAGTRVIFHNAPFDLSVIHRLDPRGDIYRLVDENAVRDTQLLHRLYALGTEGHTAGGEGESDLEHCAEVYLGARLPKDALDADGDPVRLSYGKWLGRRLREIEPVYLRYLAADVVATRLLHIELVDRLNEMLGRCRGVWGCVSDEWLHGQVRAWGLQTHHIQLRAAIVLREVTANGLHLDAARSAQLAQGLDVNLARQRKLLGEHGYLPGSEGADKALQAALQRLEAGQRGARFPRTEEGFYATSHEALQDQADAVPFVKLLLEYRETETLLSSYVGKMAGRVLHPSFDVLARTGRTTSFGAINAQSLPIDDRVRSCFVPSAGNVFLDADYSTIELATLAQACVGQFSLDSRMADAINGGKDLHTLVAAKVKHKAEAEVTRDERNRAKPISVGKAGGMGDAAMRQYAKESYGVLLSEAEVRSLSDAWFGLFPEMRDFLTDASDTPLELARFLGLTPASHHEHTGDPRFARHRENASRERWPHRILGCMCLKALRDPFPKTNDGRPYSADDIDYFWSRLEAKVSSLPSQCQQDVLQRRPSVRLQREVMSLVSRAGVFTFTGRLRAHASYCARHNTVFQGLAADGAKLALWLLWRAGYRIVNFVHDQVLIEVPADSDLKKHAETIRRLMIGGMQAVVPDVQVGVKYAASDRWYKDAEAVFDRKGRLLLWHPKPAKEKPHACP